MKRFSEQLHNKSQTVKLRAAEKRELRERLVSYMEYHPLPAELKSKNKSQKPVAGPILAEPFTTFSIPFKAIFKTSASVAILLAIIVPYVAERAVPGDVLYAVKVKFNEEIVGTLTFDSYQKVEWETERLNRRIAEARLLASEGRLTEEAEAEVADAVRKHSASAKREIEELRSQDEDAAAIASISLDSTLEVQSSSLKEEDKVIDADTTENPVNLIASAIDESRDPTDTDKASSTPPAYDKLMARVEQNTTRIYELLAGLEGVASPEEMAEVTRRAEDIDRAVGEAIKTLETDELEARKALVAALQRTQRLIVYMTEIEVSNTVDIETLIPVVLTTEEEEQLRTDYQTEIEEKLIQIDTNLETEEDQEIVEKVELARTEAGDNLVSLVSTSDFSAFRVLAEDTLRLISDSLSLLTIEPQPETNEVTEKDLEIEPVIEEDVASSSATSSDEVVEEVSVEEEDAGAEEVTEESGENTEEADPADTEPAEVNETTDSGSSEE